ncbi:YifB family Mg chelatase-like AAA ATPase [Alloscardovia venturai]|uniref:YifB family Mg chelatase-like AAA ATPase n=1 Tax=Alloscardovia venturai TaxID=1769421 RepID=A0ABW2Y504_9BIFI
MNIGTCSTIALSGLKAHLVTVQAFVSQGLPYFTMVGLPDSTVSQARERVRSACKSTYFHWPQTRVTVNLTPASLPKHGSSFDVSIAVSIFAATHSINPNLLNDAVFLGELSLDGSILPVVGMLPLMQFATQCQISRAYVPASQLAEAQLVPGIKVIPVSHINELLRVLNAPPSLINEHFSVHYPASSTTPIEQFAAPMQEPSSSNADFNDVIGQTDAKWQLEIAAAGGHHVMLVGPPGVGKSMLAQRVPSILPPLNDTQATEVACIRSAQGLPIAIPLSHTPPFASVQHNATLSALAGGANGNRIVAGAMTLAHRGVLFLDEAPEFKHTVLQSLRIPLETGSITLSRMKANVVLPAQFMLILAQNPCPCGNLWNSTKICECQPIELRRYNNRISQPIKDRIDIKINVPSLKTLDKPHCHNDSYSPFLGDHMTFDSKHMRDTVLQARKQACRRFQSCPWSTNAQAPGTWLMENTPERLISHTNHLLESEEISIRGAHKILRISWTIADIFGRTQPTDDDLECATRLYLPDI